MVEPIVGSASNDCGIGNDVMPGQILSSEFCSLSRCCFESAMPPDPVEVTHN